MIRLALRVQRADAEVVLADLLELAPSGVEEIELPAPDGGGDVIEYAVYGAPGELPDLPDLQAAAGGALVEISTSEVPDDWAERWKQFHQPVLIEAPDLGEGSGVCADADARTDGAPRARGGECLFVRPPWEAPSERADALEIVIDPAQAFGTGAHATTRLCLELLLELAASDSVRGAVLDVGCGSGVLAIAAVKLGYGPVLALDNDRESVLATAANAAVNDVEIEARRFDLRGEALPLLARDGDGVPVMPSAAANSDPPAYEAGRTVVLANLLRPLLLELADTMPASPRHLIASGLLREQADEVTGAFAKRLGLSERGRRERGEWAALWLTQDRATP
ncbi:MAG TPA: 50S ribosomal protein L11 methyltransferase [Solirubrobacteraceae bacterium]